MSHVKELLSPYIDHELSAEQSRAVETHITNCPDCRRDLEEMLSVVGKIKELPQESLPVGFMERLEWKRESLRSKYNWWFFLPFQVKITALAMTGVLVTVLVVERTKERKPSEGVLESKQEMPAESPIARGNLQNEAGRRERMSKAVMVAGASAPTMASEADKDVLRGPVEFVKTYPFKDGRTLSQKIGSSQRWSSRKLKENIYKVTCQTRTYAYVFQVNLESRTIKGLNPVSKRILQ
ncbi:MAG: zf-HC2 domain-containing protein [Elusimicrobia bacterium]|nr:zf-HC2 domain-containing protein [Elusimicrobiota bacterium]